MINPLMEVDMTDSLSSLSFRARRMHRWACLLLACCLMLCPCSAFASAANIRAQYEMAIGLMYNLTDADSLAQARRLMDELGTYGHAMSYKYYLDAIAGLGAESVTEVAIAGRTLNILAADEAFVADLAERRLPDCGQLTQYAKARQLEADGQYVQAIAAYQAAGVLDAVARAVALLPYVGEEAPSSASETAQVTPQPLATLIPTALPLTLVRTEILGIRKNIPQLTVLTPAEIINDYPSLLFRPEEGTYTPADLAVYSLYLCVSYRNLSFQDTEVSVSLTLRDGTGASWPGEAETIRLPGDLESRLLCLSLDKLLEAVRRNLPAVPAGDYTVDIHIDGKPFGSAAFSVS